MTVKVRPQTTSENSLITTYEVVLEGTSDIMFDRYAGNTTQLEPWQKLYFSHDRLVSLPAKNLMSFLSAQNTDSAPKRLLGRTYKAFCSAVASYVQISPGIFPFVRDGAPIQFGTLERLNGRDQDKLSGIYIDYDVARLKNGIPNEKIRPVLPLPWMLIFQLSLFENAIVTEQKLYNVIAAGGRMIGLGTYRGVYGKFEIVSWSRVHPS